MHNQLHAYRWIMKCLFNIIVLQSICFANEWYLLPFPGGISYNITQSNYDLVKDQINDPNVTHLLGSKEDYAYDFGMYNSTVVSVADGTVYLTSTGLNDGFGTTLIIANIFGKFDKYDHLSSILVTMGASIRRGQSIAISGNTGKPLNEKQWPFHLHYQQQATGGIYDASIPVYFSEIINDKGALVRPMEKQAPLSLNFYNTMNFFQIGAFEQMSTSDPSYKPFSRAFGLSYYRSGMTATIGFPQSEVHNHNRVSGTPYIQDFDCNNNIITLVLSKIGGLSGYPLSTHEEYFTYPIQGRFRLYWIIYYETLGVPVSYEYIWKNSSNNEYTLQWFYLSSSNRFSAVRIEKATGLLSIINILDPSYPSAYMASEIGKNSEKLVYSGLAFGEGGNVAIGNTFKIHPPVEKQITGKYTIQGRLIKNINAAGCYIQGPKLIIRNGDNR